MDTKSRLRPLTLFCLAHAGGSPLSYLRWRPFLPAEVELVPLELPGHGTRMQETALTDLPAVMRELLPQVLAHPAERFALFGHSFGSLLAFELARASRAAGRPPVGLLVAGRNGPSEPLSHRPIHGLPDDALLSALTRYGGMPEALLRNRPLLDRYLPTLRTDLRIAEEYRYRREAALDLPVLAFAGRQDVLTDAGGVLGWSHESAGAFGLDLLAGGHFFLSQPCFSAVLAERIRRLTDHPSPSAPCQGNSPLVEFTNR